jgi:hypothetical protein
VKQLLRKAQVKGREEQYQTHGIFRRPRFNETVKRVFPTPPRPKPCHNWHSFATTGH